MAIVIGAATQVEFEGKCAISANWGYNPNVQRLYCIGEWVPDDDRTFYRPTETLNITIYSPGPIYSVDPTTICADANTISASISPAACGGTFTSLSGDWLVASYSYSKEDATLTGQESWSLTRWKDLDSSTPASNFVEPTYVMRGISEGQATDNAGVVFTGTTVSTQTGNVSAGGFGRADELDAGVVTEIGGGSSVAGDTGQGSATMPYTPLYI